MLTLAACMPTILPFLRRAKEKTLTIIDRVRATTANGYREFSGSGAPGRSQDEIELVDHRGGLRSNELCQASHV